MNIQSSKKERQVFSWVSASTNQHQDAYQTLRSYVRAADDDPMQAQFQKLLRFGLLFLALLILAPFIMLGIIIGITALL